MKTDTNHPRMVVGIVDTTFSRVDMGAIALDELQHRAPQLRIVRHTVPGIKDLAVECKRLLDSGCDIALALGMVGGAPIDQQCAHEASLGIQQAKLLTNKHILEAFVHENEAWSRRELLGIFENRIRKHVQNAVDLLTRPERLTQRAGQGTRQGKEDEGPLAKGSTRIMRLGLVVSRFNPSLTRKMKASALICAKKQKVAVEIIDVPGAFDAPLAVKKLLMDKSIDGVAVIGAVVQGATRHDEVIMFNLANTLMALSLEHHRPVTLGVMGPGISWAQAKERAEPYAQNAVDAAIRLVQKLKR